LKRTAEVVLPTENGLHARPATKFVETASKFSCDVTLSKDGMVANGKSVIEILTLAAEQGSHLVICADGDDADEAVQSLSRLVQSGFQNP
jgi:phosphocarrier protein HPr